MSDIVRTSLPWTRNADDLYDDFESHERGLTDGEAAERKKEYGPNAFVRRQRTSALRLAARQFASPLIFVLIVAAGITTILQEPIDTAVILLAIIVNAALGFYQEYKAEDALERLVGYIKDRARVVRNGHEQEIDSADIVPGDIVRLSFGARVPADVRLLSVNALSTDEAILTGESLPVSKSIDLIEDSAGVAERKNMAFAGSLVVEGYGTGIVVATGQSTEIGRIAELVAGTRREPTPLQRSLASLAWAIFIGITVIVIGIFFLGISRGQPILEMLLLSVAVAVGAIPEALPVSLTVILAVGVERIAKHKGIMRSLAAAETLGSTTIIMTDKTGTLTQARMDLTGVMSLSDITTGRTPVGVDHLTDVHKEIILGALTSTDVVIENPEDAVDSWRFIGRPLESNIARAGARAGIDIVDIIENRRVPVIPFNSRHKFSVARDAKEGTIFILGAPDILLDRSTLPHNERRLVETYIQKLSDEGKRLLGVGRLSHDSDGMRPDDVTSIEFIGLLVLYDPVRPEARHALTRIRSYGARVVMVTGDLPGTARAIALELGWDVAPDRVMTGAELTTLSDEALDARLNDIEIFARVTPEDKLRIGKRYQARGEVVAMTGDGVNDAPSLKVADIGVALGSGSDVAQGVADLVILDDNFDTIVRSIEEGRRIIANIRKTFVYLMSSSLDEVILIGGGLIAGLPLPLTALQIIWVNFFTGSFPALSFAFETQTPDRSEPVTKHIFDRRVRVMTIVVSIVTSLALFSFYWFLSTSGVHPDVARSILFACFASYILIVAFSFRDLRAPVWSYAFLGNKALIVSVIGAGALLLVSFMVPFLRDLLDIVLIPAPLLWIIPAWLIANIALVEGVKYVLKGRG